MMMMMMTYSGIAVSCYVVVVYRYCSGRRDCWNTIHTSYNSLTSALLTNDARYESSRFVLLR